MAGKGSVIRKTALVAMIVGYAGLLGTLAWIPHWGFFWTFVVIGAAVGVGEIVSALVTGKTLSTNFKYAIQAGGRKAVLAYIALILLAFSILSLIVHLGVAF